MAAMSNELLPWNLTLIVGHAALINLKWRKHFSAFIIKLVNNVICKFFVSLKVKVHFKFRFDGKSVEVAKSTTFEHKYTKHLANYLGKPLTTGGWDPYHAKTEIMNLENGEWHSGPDYPLYSS